jgi:transcriptional regulator with XRE-family HTH domain
MSGGQVRTLRKQLGLTQQEAARKWRLSQTYLSLMETGGRRVPDRLARQLARVDLPLSTGLRLEISVKTDDLPVLLGTLGYPGFEYLQNPKVVTNPATVLLAALQAPVIPARVTEALPWLLVTFPDLNWDWLLERAKVSNAQNRLGYLVALAMEVAERQGKRSVAADLGSVLQKLEDARLVREDTFGRALTDVERRHLLRHRSDAARHWSLLTDFGVEQLRY